MRSTPIAPMSPLFAILTAILFLIPATIAVGAVTAPPPIRGGLLATTGFMFAIYASVWFWWRPSRFELRADGLALVFPLRTRVTPWSEIRAVQSIDYPGLKERFGTVLRVGAGGLWGGFGWLWSPKGWIEFYISRRDAMTLIEREGRLPLLLTPTDAPRFEAAVAERAGAGPQAR